MKAVLNSSQTRLCGLEAADPGLRKPITAAPSLSWTFRNAKAPSALETGEQQRPGEKFPRRRVARSFSSSRQLRSLAAEHAAGNISCGDWLLNKSAKSSFLVKLHSAVNLFAHLREKIRQSQSSGTRSVLAAMEKPLVNVAAESAA